MPSNAGTTRSNPDRLNYKKGVKQMKAKLAIVISCALLTACLTGCTPSEVREAQNAEVAAKEEALKALQKKWTTKSTKPIPA